MNHNMLNGRILCAFVTLTFFLGWSITPLIAAEKGLLDGKTFAGELIQKGKKTGDKDTLIFKDGKFRSTACDPYGFGESVYLSATEGEAITFKTETTNTKGDKMQWKGKVKGEKLEASATWIAGSKKPVEFWIKGELKK